MKFLSYFLPKKTKFGNVTAYHLFNKMWLPYSKELKWLPEKSANFYAEISDGRRYLIGPAEHEPLFFYVGPELKLGYRSTLYDAAIVCERHYRRTILGLN